MSITTKIHIEDKVFNVLKYQVNFHQPSNNIGRPSGKVTGGLWQVTIEATRDSFFLEWAVSKNTIKNVAIVQSQTSMSSKSKTIELYDVHCLVTSDDFNSVDDGPMLTHITLSPGILGVNGIVLHEKYWKTSEIGGEEEEVLLHDEDDNKRIMSFKITDSEGKQKKKFKIGEYIYLNVESINKIGDSIDIKLQEKTFDFEYNDKVLDNDFLKNYIIEDNNDIIKLKVVKPQKLEQ